MKNKNFLVSFLMAAMVLVLVATVSAVSNLGSIDSVEVDDVSVVSDDASVVAGDTVTVDIIFTSDVNASDVRVEAEIEGEKVDVDAKTSSFDVEDGFVYKKSLKLELPYELKDQLSDEITLTVTVKNGDFKTEEEYTLRVQRESYNADIKSVSFSGSVTAGETFPVDIVLKNIGYNDLDDVYVTASIAELGLSKKTYFGDIVALECDDNSDAEENYGVDIDRKCNEDNQDAASGRLYLDIPYGAEAGIYTLEVSVENDDTSSNFVGQVVIENDFSTNVIVDSYSKSVAVGENAEYSLLIVNPTNKLVVYRIVTESSGALSTSASESVVAVPAGLSKTVIVTANPSSAGESNFDVNIFSGEELVQTVTLTANAEESQVTDPIVVLTVILAIVFIVLLIVLIVLLRKKPEKSEEFGESYY